MHARKQATHTLGHTLFLSRTHTHTRTHARTLCTSLVLKLTTRNAPPFPRPATIPPGRVQLRLQLPHQGQPPHTGAAPADARAARGWLGAGRVHAWASTGRREEGGLGPLALGVGAPVESAHNTQPLRHTQPLVSSHTCTRAHTAANALRPSHARTLTHTSRIPPRRSTRPSRRPSRARPTCCRSGRRALARSTHACVHARARSLAHSRAHTHARTHTFIGGQEPAAPSLSSRPNPLLLRFPPAAQFPILAPLIPRQRKALAAVEIIRQTTADLIRCAPRRAPRTRATRP
jgi:hypothetical protein